MERNNQLADVEVFHNSASNSRSSEYFEFENIKILIKLKKTRYETNRDKILKMKTFSNKPNTFI